MQPALQFIGFIHSSLKNVDDCPLQEKENAPEARIVLFPEFTEAARDLKAGQQVLLLTWLHLANRETLTCFPRREYDAPEVGVFSTRSPDRPNPIGLHQATVLEVPGNGVIRIAALEVVDQTPLLDIKPVI